MTTNIFKKAVFIFTAIIVSFVLLNAIIWFGFTKVLFYGKNGKDVGELGRLGYTDRAYFLRKTYSDLPKKHIDYKDYKNQKIDVLTIGDSFSSGGSGGLNSYYQDYIATYNNFNVLNVEFRDYKISPEKYNNFQMLFMMLNDGFFDRVKPEYVIYESVERHCVERIDSQIDLSMKHPKTDFYALSDENNSEKLPFINISNFKFLLNTLLYRFSDNAFFSQVYIANLDRDLFSSKSPHTLLYFYKDLNRISNSTDERIIKMNENLNIISKKLKQKGIKFIFIPAVDKYDLYSDYIINKKHPDSTFFQKLRPLKKDYIFVDTKQLLGKELERGEKDIFYADDTHWSYKASAAIFRQFKFF